MGPNRAREQASGGDKAWREDSFSHCRFGENESEQSISHSRVGENQTEPSRAWKADGGVHAKGSSSARLKRPLRHAWKSHRSWSLQEPGSPGTIPWTRASYWEEGEEGRLAKTPWCQCFKMYASSIWKTHKKSICRILKKSLVWQVKRGVCTIEMIMWKKNNLKGFSRL